MYYEGIYCGYIINIMKIIYNVNKYTHLYLHIFGYMCLCVYTYILTYFPHQKRNQGTTLLCIKKQISWWGVYKWKPSPSSLFQHHFLFCFPNTCIAILCRIPKIHHLFFFCLSAHRYCSLTFLLVLKLPTTYL